ncbi:DsbA family protein [Rhizobiaceae bacterium n13]|uniref:DsbA family protein n=1 Tax=Ferirhizobium litorale TaxID=2927786 RepID=A0AAE3U2Y9_9HYPH|nr:DsbA family protein [Fererhizobium litorale]MDI7861865.1 DsbA family protein [Fererhizobium litorale]MDI7921793.1 DsbA family protein [Fererhizobium litorale]
MNRLSVGVDSGDHIAGPRSAAVTLVEYGDYECPYCGEAYPILKAVQQAMGSDLCFVFRNFPLAQMHPHAVHAADFAEMAAAEGKFWEAHDLLYENQQALSDNDLRRYGKLLGIHPAAVERAFDGRFDQKIEDDFRSGLRSGVNGTPSFFINGMRYDGPLDVDSLIAVLREVHAR